jgi:hypothetical protein
VVPHLAKTQKTALSDISKNIELFTKGRNGSGVVWALQMHFISKHLPVYLYGLYQTGRAETYRRFLSVLIWR